MYFDTLRIMSPRYWLKDKIKSALRRRGRRIPVVVVVRLFDLWQTLRTNNRHQRAMTTEERTRLSTHKILDEHGCAAAVWNQILQGQCAPFVDANLHVNG